MSSANEGPAKEGIHHVAELYIKGMREKGHATYEATLLADAFCASVGHFADMCNLEPEFWLKERFGKTRLQIDVERWETTINDFLSGAFDERRLAVMASETPPALRFLGAEPGRSMVVSYRKLKEIMDTRHHLDKNILLHVPESIFDPIMVFKSATMAGDYVMMLDLRDECNATIIVPISLEHELMNGHVVNHVRSIYPQKDTRTNRPRDMWFLRQIEDGNLVYANNEKCRQWATSSRLHLPRVGSPLNGKRNIYTEMDIVKLDAEGFRHLRKNLDSALREAMRSQIDGRRMLSLFLERDPQSALRGLAGIWLDELRMARKMGHFFNPWTARTLQGILEERRFNINEDDARWAEFRESFASGFVAHCTGKDSIPWLEPAFDKARSWASEVHGRILEIPAAEGIAAERRRLFAGMFGIAEERPDRKRPAQKIFFRP